MIPQQIFIFHIMYILKIHLIDKPQSQIPIMYFEKEIKIQGMTFVRVFLILKFKSLPKDYFFNFIFLLEICFSHAAS
jgi:hypothetical protein